MFWTKQEVRPGQVLHLPVSAVRRNPQQPRRAFDQEALQSLADSIRRYGILQPLTVRRTESGWELVAGERRLRAAKLAGLREVPCLPVAADDEKSGMLALIENLQRQDLSFLEEARGLRDLMLRFGLSQEQTAQRLGKSQSAVANKLRLLKHQPQVLEALEASGLTERHARALLALENPEEKLQLIARCRREEWSVARLEQHLREKPPAPKLRWKAGMMRDVRLFLGSVEHALTAIRTAGFPAQARREETDSEIVLTIRLSKQAVV